DIMIRTTALIAAFFFFTAQGARAGDTLLAANAVLHNFTLIGSFFLDGFATAAEQLCGRATGGRNPAAVARPAGAGAALGLCVRGRNPRRLRRRRRAAGRPDDGKPGSARGGAPVPALRRLRAHRRRARLCL